jgi:fibronectin-binding autotransporter adhesin
MRSTLITRSLVRGVGIGATLAAGVLALSPGLAFAQSGTWNVDASGDWSLSTNWDPAVVPGNAAGDVVGLTNNITAARTVTIDTTSRTVGTLNIGDSDNTHAFTLGASGGAGLTFNNSGSGAALTESGSIGDTVSTPMTLADNLTVTVGGSLGMSGVISQSGGTRSLTKTGAGGLSLTANNSYDGPTTIQGGTVSMTTSGNGGQTSPLGQSSAAAANLVINGGVLRWAGSGAASTDRLFTIGTGGAALDFSGAALGFTNTGTLGLSGADTPRTLTLTGVNSTDSNILSFSIPDNGSGATTVTKAGTGRVTLAGDSTYTGVTNVTAGRLLVASANALGSTSVGTIVSTGAQIRLFGTVTVGAEPLTLSGTGISGAEGALRIQGSSGDIATWGGAVTLNSNSLVNAGAGLTLKIGPGSGTAINLQANTLDFTGAGSHEVLGGIFGAGGISKRGTSTLTLSGSGNYSGATTLTDGKIVANATSALGTSAVTVAAGKSLELKGGFDVGGGLLTLNGESLTNVSGNNTYSGPVTAAASSRIFVTSGTLTLSNTITASSNPITFSGNGVTLISGNLGAGLTSLDINAKASDVPTVIVAGSNPDFTGTVDVQVGTLQLGDGGTTGSLPVSGAFNIGSGARVIVKQSDTVTQGTDFSGTLNGLGGFTQAGSGTTILNLANSYTGTTNVNAGTLIINGNQAAATGAVTVANGATLGGSGIIGGAVTVNGILSPGNSPGILTVGSLDLIAGSTTRMQLIGAGNLAGTAGTDYDQLVISTAGSLRYGGILDLDFANTATFDDGTTFDLFGFTGSTLGGFGSVISSGRGSYGGLTFSGVGGVWTALFGSQQLTFSELTGQLRFTTNSAVPEIDPATGSTALSLIAGVVALIEQRRRRAKPVA